MALLNFQEKDDTKAAVLVFIVYSSSQVSSAMTISLLIETYEINSSRSRSDFIMMRLILTECSANSERSPLPLAKSQQGHSLTLFAV